MRNLSARAKALAQRAAGRLVGMLPEAVVARVAPQGQRYDPAAIPPPPAAPERDIRLYIAPANSAGQGWQWARAAERTLTTVGAVSMAVTPVVNFGFAVDNAVPLGVYRWSRRWQRRQIAAVCTAFSHVIVESGRPLFGDAFGGLLRTEVEMLRSHGIRVALLFHGSDIRLPSRHAAGSAASPFHGDRWSLTPALELRARSLGRLAEDLGAPVFVSTPDLLLDAPNATWLPVVVDPDLWHTDSAPLGGAAPLVAHAPSKAVVKGSDLVDPILTRLDEEGLVRYRRIEGVRASEMPGVYAGVDIVLDQFRIGSYGVAACEAMAAGRIVVSHVTDQVREHVRLATGFDLPIVEAGADDLDRVLRGIVADRERYRQLALAGVEFVRAVHSGPRSAAALREFLGA